MRRPAGCDGTAARRGEQGLGGGFGSGGVERGGQWDGERGRRSLTCADAARAVVKVAPRAP